MNRILALTTLLTLTWGSLANAQTPPTRTLNCTNKSGKISIGICGIRDCSATVTTTGGGTKNYMFKRTKNSDGSLTYATRPGVRSKCTVEIGPLRSGIRPVTTATCARSLVGASCKIDIGSSPAPTPTTTPAN